MGGPLAVLADKIFAGADHPEQAARQVAGLLALGHKFGTDALQQAATAALGANVRSYAYVRQWLLSGCTRPSSPSASASGRLHDNVRGPAYYH